MSIHPRLRAAFLAALGVGSASGCLFINVDRSCTHCKRPGHMHFSLHGLTNAESRECAADFDTTWQATQAALVDSGFTIKSAERDSDSGDFHAINPAQEQVTLSIAHVEKSQPARTKVEACWSSQGDSGANRVMLSRLEARIGGGATVTPAQVVLPGTPQPVMPASTP